MTDRDMRAREQIELWNRRAKKDGLVTVMCSDFSEAEARLADETQKEVISRILEMVPKFTNGLEIGCGFGRLSTKWLEYGSALVAVDLSDGMLKKLPKSQALHPLIADFVNLPLKDRTFDAIFVTNILGHLKEDADLLVATGEINRVSTPNCTLFIDEMTGQEGDLIAGHYKIRNPNTISKLFSNWTVISSESYSFGRQPHVATAYIKNHSA